MKEKCNIFKNILYAFGAQGISMLLSVLMALFLPKVLGVTDYSYWQLFVFFISYAGFFHLGLNDGVYLKLGGKEYKELDYELLNSNLVIASVYQIMICSVIVLFVFNIVEYRKERLFVIVCTAIYIILCNYNGFLAYVLQVSSRIKEYSVSVVIDKASFLVIVIVGIIVRFEKFKIYVLFYIVSKLISTIYCVLKCREIVFAKSNCGIKEMQYAIDNIKIGIILTISNIASMLILGIGRLLIDSHWGIESFGKFSLALSLSNFFLQFISQVSLVLFPTFRRLEGEKIRDYYRKLRILLSTILAGMMLLYMPMYYLLTYWLPQYTESLRYMVILLPICTFDGKMNLLCNTYLKVLRKEKSLLKFNIVAMAISFVLCILSTYIINNIYAVTCSMVFSVIARSVIAEIYLSSYFGEKIFRYVVMEIGITLLFVISTWLLGVLWGFVIYLCAYILFCLARKKELMYMYRTFLVRKR